MLYGNQGAHTLFTFHLNLLYCVMLLKILNIFKKNPWLISSLTKLSGKKRKAEKKRRDEYYKKVDVLWESRKND